MEVVGGGGGAREKVLELARNVTLFCECSGSVLLYSVRLWTSLPSLLVGRFGSQHM